MRNAGAMQLVNKPRSSDAGILRPPNGQLEFNELPARSRGTTEIEAQHATEPRSADHATAAMPATRHRPGAEAPIARPRIEFETPHCGH